MEMRVRTLLRRTSGASDEELDKIIQGLYNRYIEKVAVYGLLQDGTIAAELRVQIDWSQGGLTAMAGGEQVRVPVSAETAGVALEDAVVAFNEVVRIRSLATEWVVTYAPHLDHTEVNRILGFSKAPSRQRARTPDRGQGEFFPLVEASLVTSLGPAPETASPPGAQEGTPGTRSGPASGHEWRGGSEANDSGGGRTVSARDGAAGEPTARYLTGALPEMAPTGRRLSLIVQVTLAASGISALLRPLEVPPEGRDITITVTAPGLVPLGDLEQDLHVPAEGDSDPVRFGFMTGRSGLHVVMVRAFAGGTFLAELALEISVEVGASMQEGLPRSAVLDGLVAEPGEVTLQVSRTDEDRYSFQLIGEALYPVELTRRLAGDPIRVVESLVEELRIMAGQPSPYASPALARNRIRSLGAQLWADVVPEAIRRQFWDQADRIKLFTVASDMDIVPWELLYPIDLGNDNGFLVEQFPVVRRVYGQGRVRHLGLSSAAYIVPPGSPANAMDEVQAVRARLGAGVRHHDVCSRLDSLIGLLDDAPSVLHFACHNAFTDTAGSVISLDGGPLRPSDLAPARQARSMAATSPLVFLNACRTAGEIPGLVEMMGWARQFMGAGAGAFIGSLWAVRSASAMEFADTFYRALAIDGEPLGTASLRARQAIAEDGGDPTWLAYTIYGNPSATIR